MRGEITGKDNGTASLEPADDIVAGSFVKLKIIYTAGREPIRRGGSVRFEIPYPFPPPQTLYPFDPGYTTFSSSNLDVAFHTYFAPPGYEQTEEWKKETFYYVTRWGRHVFVYIDKGELQQGDTLTCTFGDMTIPRVSGTRAPYFVHSAEFTVATDADGRRSRPFSGYHLVKDSPEVRIIADDASKLEVIASSISHKGKAGLSIQGRDNLDNLDTRCEKSVIVKLDEKVIARKKMSARDRGSLLIKDAETGESSSPAYIEVCEEGGGITSRSNPIISADLVRPYNLFWGDIHGHTRLSDGLGAPEEYYTFGRDVACLDFCAISDHAQYLSDEDWECIKRVTDEFNDDGRYVTLVGHEVSDNRENGYGDQNIYYAHADAPLLRPTDLRRSRYFDFTGLADEARAHGGMIILHQHYPGLKYYHPEVVRLTEIYSVWGASEYVDNPYPLAPEVQGGVDYTGKKVQDFLRMGFRLGIIAGSDCHAGHPGRTDWLRTRTLYTGGLSAVWAEERTRESIWQALWNRRSYGTTGARIILCFRMGGLMMGQETVVDSESPLQEERRLSVKAYGTAAIETVTFIRNNREVHTVSRVGDHAEIEWADKERLDSVNLPATADTTAPFTYYYVRVTQKDGETAWSSPIWLIQDSG
jgi:hypothetical protein